MGLTKGPKMFYERFFYTTKLPAFERIGPHNEEILSTLIGNLLGDGRAEKRCGATRFHLDLSAKNIEYIFWLHKFYSERGYCSSAKPTIKKKIGSKGQIYYSIRIRTWSFTSLNCLHDDKHVKTVNVKMIQRWFTARSLSIWLMDSGSRGETGVRIPTDGFTFSDISRLRTMVFQKFALLTKIHKQKDRWILEFNQVNLLSQIVKPYMLPCMYSKING
jgi:hypothetical protein